MKNPHSPVTAQVWPGHKNDLLADMDIHDTKEFTSSQRAYKSLVPRDEEPNVDTVFEHKFEQHAPSPEATNELPRVIGSDTMPPIFGRFSDFCFRSHCAKI